MDLITEMAATCIECGRSFEAHPIDFLYHATGLAPHEAPAGVLRMGDGFWVTCGEIEAEEPVTGYCGPCAAQLAQLDHEMYRNGSWERRTIEDETYIWDR